MSNKPTVVRNTPKGVIDDTAIIPSAYNVLSLTLKNSEGQTYDMRPLITSFSIVEDLLSPVIVFNAKIRDNVNFFEDFAITGQEILNVELQKQNIVNSQIGKINLTLIVKEYPNYEKSTAAIDVQEYNFIAVSNYGYASMLKKTSRSVKGNVVDNIKATFEKDLDVTQCVVDGNCSSIFDGIITIQSPLKAIEWLRSKAFDDVGAPFFVYGTVTSDFILIRSLTNIVKSAVYNVYTYKQYLENSPQNVESYTESSSRILYMKSNIKLDKLKQATQGGFASKTDVIDLGGKTYAERVFNFAKSDDAPKARLQNVLTSYGSSKNFFTGRTGKEIRPFSLTDSPDASFVTISTNSNTNSSGAPNTTTGPILDNIGRAKSLLANMESMSHEIEVFGDFTLSPGLKIQIEIPKSADIKQYNEINPQKVDQLDKSLSGEYIVAVTAHTFKEGVYKTRLKIIKDNA